MSLTHRQKINLHKCTSCGHLLASHDGSGCVTCQAFGEPSCAEWPTVIETTYEAIEALLDEARCEWGAEQ